MIPQRAEHTFPAGDALLVLHLKRLTNGLRYFELVIWIDDKRTRELLGSTRKFRKDQNPGSTGS